MSGDYVVGAVIGEGLMGPRSAGRFRPSGHPVSLEEVPSPLLDRPDFVEQLAVTGRRAAAVAVSSVAAVYDLVRIGHRLYVVSELVRGRSLAALLAAEHSLPLPTAMLIVDSVLAGLEGIHEAGLTHGDVCPDVIVITAEGTVRITGLGVATVLATDPALPASPAVAPPEGGAPSVAADLYATGALLRELVSGMRPEESGEVEGPERLAQLVNRSLAGVAEARFATATEFREELESAGTELLGPGWRVRSDLAARATRSLGPQPPRGRLPHTVTVSLASEPPSPPSIPATAADPSPDDPTPAGAPGDPTPAAAPPVEPSPVDPETAREAVTAREAETAWEAATARDAATAREAATVREAVTAPPGPAAEFGTDPFAPPERPQGAEPGARPAEDSARPPRRRRRRRWIWVLVGLVVVAAAGTAGAFVLLQPPAAPAPAHPLAVGDDVRLAVEPGNTGDCDTTFTFVATGSLSGSGTLAYQWVSSTAGETPVFTRFSVTIPSTDASFRFTTPFRLTGTATIDATVTFQVLSPQARSASQTVHYACPH